MIACRISSGRRTDDKAWGLMSSARAGQDAEGAPRGLREDSGRETERRGGAARAGLGGRPPRSTASRPPGAQPLPRSPSPLPPLPLPAPSRNAPNPIAKRRAYLRPPAGLAASCACAAGNKSGRTIARLPPGAPWCPPPAGHLEARRCHLKPEFGRKRGSRPARRRGQSPPPASSPQTCEDGCVDLSLF